jgi:cell division protein ZapB
MLEQSLKQLEQLVTGLVKANQNLHEGNAQLTAQLQQIKEENESLQLSALEQDDQHSATIARIQALVAVASTGQGGAGSNAGNP